MVVPIIGSLAVRGVFAAGSLLSGLGKTVGKLKETQSVSKSTTTEMGRLTKSTHALRGALAMIGVGGFTALLMTTPQLAGSLAKIKYEMKMLAWSIGKHLKPSLDAVATILRGIRTGDWSVVKQGIKDLTDSVVDLASKAGGVVLNIAFGKESADQAKTDFDNWIESLKVAWREGDFWNFLSNLILDPIKYAIEQAWNLGTTLSSDYDRDQLKKKGFVGATLGTLGDIFSMRTTRRTIETGERSGILSTWGSNYDTGPKWHSNANDYSTHNTTIDFNGANIHLASGLELDQFAEALSNKSAERQNKLNY